MKHIPEIVSILVMQYGMAAGGLLLTRWEWWVATFGATAYAISMTLRREAR